MRLGWRIAEATGIAARRVAASSVDVSHGLGLAIALSLATHIGLLAAILAALTVVRGLLHVLGRLAIVVWGLALHEAHVLGTHELALVLVRVGRPSPVLLLLLV